MSVWAAWTPAIITVVGWIFTLGMTMGRIKDQEVTLKDHHDILKDHGTQLNALGNRMTASEAWRQGYDAGRNNIPK
jgi:hypothetical protein